MKQIELYTTKDGKCPFTEWLKTIDIAFRVRITKRINRMRDGNFGDWKQLKDSELCEARLFFGKGYRIYYKELDDVIILILAGGDKSSQEVDIKKSNKYFEDYIDRKNNNDNKI